MKELDRIKLEIEQIKIEMETMKELKQETKRLEAELERKIKAVAFLNEFNEFMERIRKTLPKER